MADLVHDVSAKPVVPPRPVKFNGRLHNDEFGVLGEKEAPPMKRICKIALCRDYGNGVGEGDLASRVGMRITDRAWQIAIHRLLQPPFSFIETVPANYGNAIRIKLTRAGKDFARELVGDREQIGLDGKGQ